MNKLLVILLLLISCARTPDVHSDATLETLSKSMKRTGDYISRNFLNYYGPKDLPEEENRELVSAFNHFLKLYNKVEKEYQGIMGVKLFLVEYLNESNNYDPKDTNENSPQNVAKALLHQTGIDLNEIDKQAELERLAKELSVSNEELRHGIFFLFSHPQSEIY